MTFVPKKDELIMDGLFEVKQDKIQKAAEAYGKFMDEVLPGWQEDPHSKETPLRVAKAFINDIAKNVGKDAAKPHIKSFENEEGYTGLIFQGGIPVKSLCAHHHQSIFGQAYVSYIPGKNKEDKIIGLSKLNRIVEYYSRMPQVQERLTKQIHDEVDRLCKGNRGVAVVIRAKHACAGLRGVNHHDSEMQTAQLSGYFFDNEIGTRQELYSMIDSCNK